MRLNTLFAVTALSVLFSAMTCEAEIKTVVGHNRGDSETLDFTFKNMPQPS